MKKTTSHAKPNNGQVLISILISIAVFSILAHAIFTLIASSFDLVSLNRARITAIHLAQEKMELIRNLSYDEVGTVGGIPNGILQQTENVESNGLNFTVKIDVAYVDDPYNGGSPNNTDYKRARVEVSWSGLAASRKSPITLITDITPQVASVASGGTLTVLVFDANGVPVPQAEVTIVADTISPPVNATFLTNDDGIVNRPGAVVCDSCYQISVTKAGFSGDRTYSTSEVANPLKPHMSVLDGQVTQISFFIDEVSTLNIASFDSRENNFTPKGNVTFRLRGNKIIGTDAYLQPVYKYDETLTTDGGGNLTISDLEWDTYQVLTPSSTTYDISGTTPLLPLSVLPASTLDFSFSTDTHTDNNLLMIVKDPSQSLIDKAYVRIYDDGGFQDSTTSGKLSDPDFGQLLFSNLNQQTYHLEATKSGYLKSNVDLDVSGSSKGVIILNP